MSSWKEIIERANTDSQFRTQLKADPVATCAQAGVAVPTGTSIAVIEDRSDELHLFLNGTPKDPELKAVIERARNDAAFKSRLLTNPRSSVESALGRALPPATKVFVHDPQPSDVHLILSARSSSQELSDEELAAVAGGGLLRNIVTKAWDLLCRDKPVAVGIEGTNDAQATGVWIQYDNSPGGYGIHSAL